MKAVVAISGNVSRPSKTRTLVEAIAKAISERLQLQSSCYDILDVQPDLGASLYRSDVPGPLSDVLSAIETSAVLVVGSPTYKASFTGLLKHLFDLVDMKALNGRPVIVCATGKAAEHGPKVEQHFRMLFEFFNARVGPKFIFALDDDFSDDGRPSEALLKRIQEQVREAETIGLI
ncbi:NADPH-dependent FMN reductase [Rhizobium laguerreae]|uniref:NADPH-dependent FMN reductase n=1 Tax=Rhizobium laguerreae TaxID=1076926 RepID=UPI001C8FFBAF|nr:NADPH-dependent FMN reductase [Rhizobium laguerreae]MBY3468723.1 NADPH-dependent FMN reductase [Rhizobium laguerreae]